MSALRTACLIVVLVVVPCVSALTTGIYVVWGWKGVKLLGIVAGVGLAYAIVHAFAEGILTWLALLVWPDKKPPATGLCPNCGYDIRATPSLCPECGSPQSRRSAG